MIIGGSRSSLTLECGWHIWLKNVFFRPKTLVEEGPIRLAARCSRSDSPVCVKKTDWLSAEKPFLSGTPFNFFPPSRDMFFSHWVGYLDADADIVHLCLSNRPSSHHHQRQFHNRTQTQLERAPPSGCLALSCSTWIASVGNASDGEVLIMLANGARRSKTLKRETVLA
jgi:hypothetical protein